MYTSTGGKALARIETSHGAPTSPVAQGCVWRYASTMRITPSLAQVFLILTTCYVSACAHSRCAGGNPAITASGEGKASGTPDQALITVAAITEGKDAESTAAESARIETQVIAAAKSVVGNQGSLKTSSYSLNPVYDFNENKQTLRGYQVRNAITVEMFNTKAVGALIDAAVKAGATEVSSISFGVRDSAALRKQAIAAASQAALREAAAAAIALGLQLGKVRTIAVGSTSGGPVPMPMQKFSRAMDSAQIATPVEAGTVDVTASVSVEVQLEKP